MNKTDLKNIKKLPIFTKELSLWKKIIMCKSILFSDGILVDFNITDIKIKRKISSFYD